MRAKYRADVPISHSPRPFASPALPQYRDAGKEADAEEFGSLKKHSQFSCEVVALLFVLSLYEQESKYDGDCRLERLYESYGKGVRATQLVKHFKEVEQFFGIHTGVLSRLAELTLERVDAQFFRELIPFYAQPYEPGDAMRALKLPAFPSQSLFYGKLLPDTSLALTYIAGKLLACGDDETFLAPYAGYGLAAALIHTDNARKPALYLQDRDPVAAGMAAAYAVLFRDRIGEIRCEDGLKKIFPEGGHFDKILMDQTHPAFDAASFEEVHPDTFDSDIARTIDMVPFAQALHHLNADGLALVLCSMPVLYKTNSKNREGREALLRGHHLDAVIELPPEVLPASSSPMALIVLKQETGKDTVRMIDGHLLCRDIKERNEKPSLVIPSMQHTDTSLLWSLVHTLPALYRGEALTQGLREEDYATEVPVRRILENGANYCVAQYFEGDRLPQGEVRHTDIDTLLQARNRIMDAIRANDSAYMEIVERLVK